MNINNSAWNKSTSIVERIKINEEFLTKKEAQIKKEKEAQIKKEKEAKNIERELARLKAHCILKAKQEDENRASYRKRIPYEYREIWDYCDTRTYGKMYKDFIIAAFESNKLKLIDTNVILYGSDAVIEEAKKYQIKI